MRRSIVLVLTGAAVVAGLVEGGALAAPRDGGALAAPREGGALAAAGRTAAPRQSTATHRAAATASPAVMIRIEGARRTLVPRTLVRARSGSITKYGAPRGKCSAKSVQGALNKITNGQWKGRWSAQFKEYFITSILGEKPSRHNFWEIFVNNKAATKGACDLKLQKGEQILFADTNGKRYPSEMGVFKSQRSASGVTYSVELIGFNAHGKSKPLAGVQITGPGIQTATTDAKGQAMVTDDHAGPVLLRSAPKSYIRSEVEVFGPSG